MRASAEAQVTPRLGARVVILFLVLALLVLAAMSLLFPAAARAEMMKGEVSTNTSGGYARLVFTFPEDNEADVRVANGIIVIGFQKPVDVKLDRVVANAGAYVSVARRDPDGTAVRLALVRKVTVNTMAAGERLFVDLLPENWVGVPPGLPQEVIDHLARRARDAEKKARQTLLVSRQRQLPPIRVRVGTHPTFTRYVFEMPELVPVSADQDRDRLSLLFDAPLRFDLVDAKAALPPAVAGIVTPPGQQDTAEVTFTFNGKVDVRTFREDLNFVLDVTPSDAAAGGKAGELPELTADDKAAASGPLPPSLAAPPARTARPQAPPPAEAPPSGTSPPGEPAKTAEAPAAVPEPKPAAPPAGAVASRSSETAPGAMPPAVTLESNAPVAAELRRDSDTVRLTFPFAAPTPAAVFRRFDTLWLVFDTEAPIDVARLLGDPGRLIRNAEVTRSGRGQVVRLKLERPRLASTSTSGTTWTVALGDIALDRTAPVTITRASLGGNRAVGVIPFDAPHEIHRLADPDVGDTLLVVTALAPARGVLRNQDFVEFRALASIHGIVIQPLADDVAAELNRDKIVVTRPGGLTLSAVSYQLGDDLPESGNGGALFDSNRWGADRRAQFTERQRQLMQAAAGAPEAKRQAARLDLARFYLGRELFPEAKAVLDVSTTEDRPSAEQPSGLMLRAVAKIMMDRSGEGLKDLANPIISNLKDATLWRAFALARQGRWSEAREGFKNSEQTITTLPIELQRAALKEQLRAAIEVRDFGDAAQALNELETLGIPRELQPAVAVLSGRLAENLGRISDALASYRSAAASPDLPSAAQGRLREILLRYSLKILSRNDAIAELEALTTLWRGDETEIEALEPLAHFYIEEQRYRDAFYVLRTALAAHAASPVTRRIQDEAAATFDKLFLGGVADSMPPVEALSLFYDFRDLTPSGRRGDEMIRRLADRLVAVDLLGQAAELLQHQVDHRLQGAARAEVATRLAVIYLMNRKPDRAFQALRATRAAELSTELRNQRLLIEARALSDTGRHDLALEVVANLTGREVDRLRGDIMWSARRWRDAAEALEKLYGERWREFTPLTETERPDILRAAIGFALADDQLGLDRLREKYGPKMAEGPLARAFEVVTTPFATNGAEFRAIARSAVAADTLEQFLRDMRSRYPEMTAAPPPPTPEPQTRKNEPQRSTSAPSPAGRSRHVAAR